MFSEHFLLQQYMLCTYIYQKKFLVLLVYMTFVSVMHSHNLPKIFFVCLCVNLVMIFLKILVGGKIEFLWETQNSSHEQFCSKRRSCFYKSGKIFQQFREKQKESIKDLIICSHDSSNITIIIIEQNRKMSKIILKVHFAYQLDIFFENKP